MGSLSLLQGIFPTQGSNPGLPHGGRILYQLSHKGSPGILERVSVLLPVDLLDPGIELGSPALQADSLPTELSGNPSSQVAQLVKNPPVMWETWVQSLGWEESLGRGTATHSSILAWTIPRTV